MEACPYNEERTSNRGISCHDFVHVLRREPTSQHRSLDRVGARSEAVCEALACWPVLHGVWVLKQPVVVLTVEEVRKEAKEVMRIEMSDSPTHLERQ